MAWRRGKYYVKSRRVGRRVLTDYIGTGFIAEVTAIYDQRDQAQRAEHRAVLRQIAAAAADAPELRIFLAYVRDQVHAALIAAGYHQHKRGEWRRYMTKAEQPIAVMGPQPFDEWAMDTCHAMECADPPQSVRDEYRRLLKMRPRLAQINGDLSLVVQREMRRAFGQAVTVDAIEYQAAQLRKAMVGDGVTPLETLLIDQVVLCWHDYHLHEAAYAGRYRDGLTLDAMEAYERILSSKQRRYERAIRTLAEVRRLLRLPAVQVNIGAQQIIGDVHHEHSDQPR